MANTTQQLSADLLLVKGRSYFVWHRVGAADLHTWTGTHWRDQGGRSYTSHEMRAMGYSLAGLLPCRDGVQPPAVPPQYFWPGSDDVGMFLVAHAGSHETELLQWDGRRWLLADKPLDVAGMQRTGYLGVRDLSAKLTWPLRDGAYQLVHVDGTRTRFQMRAGYWRRAPEDHARGEMTLSRDTMRRLGWLGAVDVPPDAMRA